MNKKILLQDLSERMAQRRSMSKKDADLFVRSVFEIIGEYLQTDKIVKIKGLGTFKLIMVDSRASVDVNTGERIVIKGYTKVSFTPDAALRDEINKPFAQFETVILNEGTDVAEMERVDEPEPVVTAEPDSAAEETEVIPESETLLEEVAATEDESRDSVSAAEVKEEAVVVVETAAIDDEDFPEETSGPVEEPESAKEEEVKAETVTEELIPEPVENPLVDARPEEEASEVKQQVGSQHVEYQKVEHQTVENQHIVQVAPEQPQGGTAVSMWKRGAMALLVLVLMCGSYYAGYRHWLFSSSCNEQEVPAPEVRQMEVEPVQDIKPEEIAGPDTVSRPVTQKTDSVRKPVEAPQERVKENTYPQVEGGEYEIVGTKEVHRLAPGETLRGLSLKYYGSKDYVKYIITYNDIKNPDVVPVNMELKMPELKLKRR